jgi:hypothetical protein
MYVPEYAPVPVREIDDPYAPDEPKVPPTPDTGQIQPLWGKGSDCPWCKLPWDKCQCDQDAAAEIRERKRRGYPERYCEICGAPAAKVRALCSTCYADEMDEDYDREDI